MNDFLKEKLAGLTPQQREQLRQRSAKRAQQPLPEAAGELDFSLVFFLG
ncbi:hypothetical protein [Dickeya poaceiphila]|nr:hypothetical protein [Dickeya poaceiphila]